MNVALDYRDVARWFLSKQPMTSKKLQKLMYYAYSWGLVFLNDDADSLENKLFDLNFEAWVHGPVARKLYPFYAENPPFSEIPKYEGELTKLNEDLEDILNQVNEIYGGFNGNELERLTHTEKPWIEARKDCLPMDSCSDKLSDETIYKYYVSLLEV